MAQTLNLSTPHSLVPPPNNPKILSMGAVALQPARQFPMDVLSPNLHAITIPPPNKMEHPDLYTLVQRLSYQVVCRPPITRRNHLKRLLFLSPLLLHPLNLFLSLLLSARLPLPRPRALCKNASPQSHSSHPSRLNFTSSSLAHRSQPGPHHTFSPTFVSSTPSPPPSLYPTPPWSLFPNGSTQSPTPTPLSANCHSMPKPTTGHIGISDGTNVVLFLFSFESQAIHSELAPADWLSYAQRYIDAKIWTKHSLSVAPSWGLLTLRLTSQTCFSSHHL